MNIESERVWQEMLGMLKRYRRRRRLRAVSCLLLPLVLAGWFWGGGNLHQGSDTPTAVIADQASFPGEIDSLDEEFPASLAVMVMREGMPSLELWDGPMLAGTDLDFSLDPVWAGGGDGVADSRSF